MKTGRISSIGRSTRNNKKSSSRDAIRVLLALVFILFASMASREHDSAEKTFEQQELAQAQDQIQARNSLSRPRPTESRSQKLTDFLSRINGSI